MHVLRQDIPRRMPVGRGEDDGGRLAEFLIESQPCPVRTDLF